ncbi:MAG: peptide chain release factor N(5)-glutamine methyltransferase [Patescibacteria group bacterium]
MTVNEALNAAKKSDRREAELLLAAATGKDRAFIKSHGDVVLKPGQVTKYNQFIKRRSAGEPIAYIVGFQPFCGWDFAVDQNVLIPRPETEQLVEIASVEIKQAIADGKKIVVADIGTGSGCIALTIATRFKDVNMIASDNSPATLSVVKHNCKKLSTENVTVIQDDLFGKDVQESIRRYVESLGAEVFVVANLPYLPYSDTDDMQKDVIDYEPHTALFADDDGMALNKKLLKQFFEFRIQNSEFRVLLEMDPRQARDLSEYARRLWPKKKISVEKDLCGRDRFLIIR